jgi:hypothetical protein
MGIQHHDAYRHIAFQNVSYNTSGGASAQSSAFSSQTYWIRVCAAAVVGATQLGVRIKVGDNPTATSSSALLPMNWVEVIRCTPGQKIAAIAEGATAAGTLSVTELSD